MARGVETIRPDQIRGRDLHDWHIVVVECFECRRARVMHHKYLKDVRHRDLLLSEMKFSCHSCDGLSGPHHVTIMIAPRHY
jgi:hypothetical protein